jgi:hypothetical protein
MSGLSKPPRSFAAAAASKPVSIPSRAGREPPARDALPRPQHHASKSSGGRGGSQGMTLNNVFELFPNIDRSTISEVYEFMDCDASRVIDYFLTMQTPVADVMPTTPPSAQKSASVPNSPAVDLKQDVSLDDFSFSESNSAVVPMNLKEILGKSQDLFSLKGGNFFAKIPLVQLESILRFMQFPDLARFSCVRTSAC